MTDDAPARELLADEEAASGWHKTADLLRSPDWGNGPTFPLVSSRSAVRAITRALASPQDVGVERAALEQLRGLRDKASAAHEAHLDACDRSAPEIEIEAINTLAVRTKADFAHAATNYVRGLLLASAPAQPEQELRTPNVMDLDDPTGEIANGPSPAAQPVDEGAKYQLAREVLLKAVRYYRPKYSYVDLPITISPAEALRAILASRPSAYIKGLEDAAKEADRFNPLIGNAIRNLIQSLGGADAEA